MKKILILLTLSIFIISCKRKSEKEYTKHDKNIPKKEIKKLNVKRFKKGDIVYVKPDSLKVTITCVNFENQDNESYDISFFVAGNQQTVTYLESYNFY